MNAKNIFVTLSFAVLLIAMIACKLFVPEDTNQDKSATPQVMDGEKLPTPVLLLFHKRFKTCKHHRRPLYNPQ
jgi:hypothetical protein